ncbi:hypothetical protein [Labrys neptuniae]
MLFNIESDEGGEITGYVVPDDYEKTPVLRVLCEGKDIARISCREPRPALISAGRHASGLCGFLINEAQVPGLAQMRSLEVLDEESGLLIYRRNLDAPGIQLRLFRLETHLFPLFGLDATLKQHFDYFHRGIERFGSETATQVFHLDNAPSLYVSGRLTLRQYEALLYQRFTWVTLLHDPYYELAERLTALKLAHKYDDALLGPRDLKSFKPAIDFATTLELNDKDLSRAFAEMSGEVIASLSNPIARQLACDSSDGPLPRGAVATALANLATSGLVGIRERAEDFAEDLEQIIGIPAGVARIAPLLTPVQALANQLRAIPEVEVLLEVDIDIYDQVRAAIAAAG